MNKAECFRIGACVWERYKSFCFPPKYTTVLALYSALRFAGESGNGGLRKEALEMLEPFWCGRVASVGGHYGENVYRFGGNASAYAVRLGWAGPEAKRAMIRSAELVRARQPRFENGMFCQKNWYDGKWNFRWIDTVFGVCPFLLWTGLESGRGEFIDEAVFQMRKHYELLFDPARRLYHQAADASRPGVTPGYWSRGMGWAMHALVDLAAELPEKHPDYEFIQKIYRDAADGCAAAQDEDGMWHQSMDDFGTFAESSGTGLILYAVGKGLRLGLLDAAKYRRVFGRGIEALSGYVCLDGSVQNGCGGCCCPGYNGTAADYDRRGWILNDPHAFGPVILAFTEAYALKNSQS